MLSSRETGSKVEVGSGWITLEGDVDWHYQKAAAHDAVCHLRGVTGVTDKIALRPATVSNAVKAHVEGGIVAPFWQKIAAHHNRNPWRSRDASRDRSFPFRTC